MADRPSSLQESLDAKLVEIRARLSPVRASLEKIGSS